MDGIWSFNYFEEYISSSRIQRHLILQPPATQISRMWYENSMRVDSVIARYVKMIDTYQNVIIDVIIFTCY